MAAPIIVAVVIGLICLLGSGCGGGGPTCGDGICNSGETYQSCPADCPCSGYNFVAQSYSGTFVAETDYGYFPCASGILTWTDPGGNPQTGPDSCTGNDLDEYWWDVQAGKARSSHVVCANGAICQSNPAGAYCG